MPFLNEAALEAHTLELLSGLGYATAFGPDIAFDGTAPERESYGDVVLDDRLYAALARINPALPASAIEEAVRKVSRWDTPSLLENNRRFHTMLTDGVPVEFHGADGRIVHDAARLMDFDDPDNNDWLAVNQVTIIENNHNRRPDVVVFINGLPLVVVELKNPGDENTTIKHAFNQLQTYKKDIPVLFGYNALLAISDGFTARAGTLTADWERFMPWRTVDGLDLAPEAMPQWEVLLAGLFDKRRLLDYIRYFIVFEDDGGQVLKKAAAYHQYHAVNKAVECTVRAVEGDRRIGVVWHTQGSGKSLSMAFYAGKIIQHPALANPTLVVLTDRNDLDDQLLGTFSRCAQLLRQSPVQAGDRKHLRDLLQVAAGGVVFTTIQKFLPEQKGDTYPLLSERRNIIVIADEAHRSQYDFIDGFARHMRDALPNAAFIGFTGTPIESADKSTPAVFGDYIDVYDIQQAVEDGATVRIYYEGRLAKIDLSPEEKPHIDPQFEEITEDQEEGVRTRLKSRWARLEAMVGTDKRLALVAEDIVAHFEARDAVMPGKAMVVCMSRRICVDLYRALTALRPEWHHGDDTKGAIKVVMTGSASDPTDWQEHVRNKAGREALAKRFKDPADPLKLVIVRDMWLTGFDVPCLHTMYVDKPMRGHGLMQAIARVNRVFKDKPGGLVVDYLGLAEQLKQALADYTASGGKGKTTVDQNEAAAVLEEKYEVVRDLYHGFDYLAIVRGPRKDYMAGAVAASSFILGLEDGRKRYFQAVAELSKAFALTVPHATALRLRDEVGFFQVVRACLAKTTMGPGPTEEELDTAIRQIVSGAIVSDQVIDIFAAAGLKKPDISILSDEFLEEVRRMPHRNLAVEILRKLLNNDIKTRLKRNVVQARSFAAMLEQAIRKYQNRTIEAAQVISELIELAKELRAAQQRGQSLGLTDDEVAFYDALEVNDSAVMVLGDESLKLIAHELVQAVRNSVTIDWNVRDSARARIRLMVKRILRKYGYPPDKQEKATQTVLEQAEALCAGWAVAS